ncbi:MAG: glycosyltransferase family 2 protein [Bacilli bacterium]|jgi:glycosyltransferase involved in cell wall biosynthesis|nr:glycosyltransferase family 2 protein [Bacilli bacterium]
MKLISFAIPCYNSQEYMNHCIDSLLVGKEEVEIIIINDGSKDDTLKIAKEYEQKHPHIIKVIDKENGGHGSGVNKGLEVASGLYYKVVDSDDWADEESVKKILNQIKKFQKQQTKVDLLIANYVYEKDNQKKTIRYRNLPENKLFTWQDIKPFKIGEYLLMHSVFYRTDFLRSTKIHLPEHTFYVDNIFVYLPLFEVKNMYYLNTDFYHYFIGREDQSVNEKIMIERIDQQIKVTQIMLHAKNPLDYQKENPKLMQYQLHYLAIMLSICTILLKVKNTVGSKKKIQNLWNELKEYDMRLYRRLRYHSLASLACLPRVLAVPGYHLAQKIYKFN